MNRWIAVGSLTLSCLPWYAAPAAADDGIVLTVVPGSSAAEVSLSWTGGFGPYLVYRSSAPAALIAPGNILGQTGSSAWVDSPPAGVDSFYAIVSACVPTTCVAQNANCGSMADGCGGTLSCGSCLPPQFCGGGGIPNRCGGNCVPRTCAQIGATCGPQSNGCGGTLDCGTCPPGQICIGTPSRCITGITNPDAFSTPPGIQSPAP